MELFEQLQGALSAAYTLEHELGGGGMSRVFLATERALDRKVVVKVLSPDLAAGLSAERFAREIRFAASLQQPVERSWRLAVTIVGQVMWELIEPLDDASVYARFLAEKGEGVHHVAVAAPSFDDAVAAQGRRGNKLLLSGTFSGAKVAYLPTDRDLGVTIEIFSGTPVAEAKPDAT